MCCKATFTSFGFVVDSDVDRTISTSRSLEYALIATNISWGMEHRNQCAGYATVLVVVVSSEGGLGVFLDYLLDMADISQFLPIGQCQETTTFPLAAALFLPILGKLHVHASVTALCCSVTGMIIRQFLSTTSDSSLTVSSSFTFLKSFSSV